MIRTIARHKLTKFSHSRMILIFVLAGLFIGLIVFLPVIVSKAMAPGMPIGGGVAATYFDIVEFFGAAVALVLGVLMWRQDAKDGTLSIFLARPISRTALLAGKLLGSIYALLLFLGITLLVYFAAHLLLLSYDIPLVFLLYLVQVMVKWLVILSFGLAFSSLVNSLLAAVLVIGYFTLGTIGKIVLAFPSRWTQVPAKIIKVLVMDIDKGCQPETVLLTDMSSLSPLLIGIAYYALWSVMLLSLSIILFSRREFSGSRT
ncbi:MAG: ABC transporter permease subunit [candidate division Zixibacteria bacterium]|nr:ABC transporter permease subunit [candidate division Zixibacteria bacterium]